VGGSEVFLNQAYNTYITNPDSVLARIVYDTELSANTQLQSLCPDVIGFESFLEAFLHRQGLPAKAATLMQFHTKGYWTEPPDLVAFNDPG
jgi:hypothetical protein